MNDVYTHGHDESVLRSHKWRTIENSAAYIEHLLSPGSSLLDIGCGPGNLTAEFASRTQPGSVVGIDIGTEIVDSASATYPAEKNPDLRFEVGDAYALDFPDNSFDIVHAHQVLQHVSDPVALLREASRVCNPGGHVAVRDADYGAMSWYPELPELDTWRSIYRQVCHRNDAQPDAARRLLRWSRLAGFENVKPSASVWCFADSESSAWWGGLWADRILQSALAEQAIKYELASAADLEQLSSAWLTWAADPDAWFLVPHGELLWEKGKSET